ncbi:hypothetical protein Mterra_03323 [Calidithermus terrae]|uniref:Lipoprotein n=1 Tax=Calidithermus terrae TaxID=1408545 RepID=A0A399EDG1_9DEIN|nr:hypothetical protein [Calidithermus terrae]RIH81199.1 hypothetical protein Mterra_03323 [Calidithermus terrae]
MQLERLAKTLTASLVAAVALSACAPNVTAPAMPSQVRALQADFDACAGNVNGRLDAVVNTYYPDFKRGKFVSVVFPRTDVEVARYLLTDGTQGKSSPGKRCPPSVWTLPQYLELKKKLEHAEALTAEIETAKGLKFNGLVEGNLTYVDLKTNRVLTRTFEFQSR